ncbi:VOC family protein [Haloglycomyces albus]|uniref:VOC family protein n=1 Tax=Haloglycomyces albus TaxID=526067 RepID=UPI00046D1429|nr:VOC family protein [Haloglycomyces albus]
MAHLDTGTTHSPADDGLSTAGRSSHGFGLHHVQLSIPTGAEDVAREYYVDVLGMREVPKPPELAKKGGLWLRTDSLEIHLGIEPNMAAMEKAHPGIVVREVTTLARILENREYQVNWDDDFIGFRRFHTRDPFGNRLEFMQLVEASTM